MTVIANLHGVLAAITSISKFRLTENAPKRSTMLTDMNVKKKEEIQETSVKNSRRVALSLASIAVVANSFVDKSLADDNGYWLTTPLPIPHAINKIANKETGTRSFLKNGIYVANIGKEGRMDRLKKCAFELLTLEDEIGQDTWHFMRMYIRLKSTFMYFDFDNVISASLVEDKQPLIDLANRLFDNVEELEVAVRKHDLPVTQSVYQDTAVILKEVMARMA